MRQVIFKHLWLVSERERKARKIPLEKSKILLLGDNGTGKSRITKNIFWALGCEPQKRDAGAWNPDAIAALTFIYNERELTAIRAGKWQGLFTSTGQTLFISSNHGAWSDYASQLFGYRLKLQRPKGESFRAAGLDYLTVPYYVDQDGSWGVSWSTFKNLGQFKDWQKPVFSGFTGQRPNAYLEAKQVKDEATGRARVKQKELEHQREALQRVKDVLPKNLPSLDLSTFRAELTELAARARKIQENQVKARAELAVVVGQREKVEAELRLAVGAHKELMEDLSYLSKIPDDTNIECPTCGTIHATSFHSRLVLGADADEMAALVAELNARREDLQRQENEVRRDLTKINKDINKFDELQQTKKERLRLEEVIAANSRRMVERAFFHISENLTRELTDLDHEIDALTLVVKKYEDRERLKKVTEYYAATLRNLSDFLNIPQDERVDETKLGSRPASGGSSGPRAILAVHLALLATNVEFGDTVRLPLVVDTPQQSGQDENNLGRMIKAIEKYASTSHQVVLALERIPSGLDLSDFNVFELSEKQRILQDNEFDDAIKELGWMAKKIDEHRLEEHSDASKLVIGESE